MKAIEKLVETFLNGNISDARKKAKNYGYIELKETLEQFGHSANKAYLGACFLKSGNNWQWYCDAE